MSMIVENIARLRETIQNAARRAGRPPEAVRFILVTKTVPPERIEEAVQAGVRDFGENRVQELVRKKKLLPSDLNWHMIGHLQTNKVKQVLGEVALIHSLDRPELAEEVEKQAVSKGLSDIPCLVQVKAEEQPSKSGFLPDEAVRFVEKLKTSSPLRLKGLMAIGPLTDNTEEIRRAFRRVARLQTRLAKKAPQHEWSILSMGMSGDYEIAIEEGATLLRIGTAVFGERK